MTRHVPVLLDEISKALRPEEGQVYIDATFGAGGYSQALLNAANCSVIAIDRDPNAIKGGQEMKKIYKKRLTLLQGCFSEMKLLLDNLNIRHVDGVIFDLGVSSMQLDEGARGFSFMREGALDMRMSQKGVSAADIVNHIEEKLLAQILFLYGEERRARAIARAIVERRKTSPITTTSELSALIETVMGSRVKKAQKIHPATRSFQALRIYVNDELGELLQGLLSAEKILRPEGMLAVVSFHSLEDRIAKRFLSKRLGRSPQPSRHLPPSEAVPPSFHSPYKKAIKPSDKEIESNPRARSARLRLAWRSEAAAFPPETLSENMPRIGEAI